MSGPNSPVSPSANAAGASQASHSTQVMPAFAPPPPLSVGGSTEGERRKMWKHWRQRFDSYALITGLADRDPKIGVATLTLCLGEEALEIVETLPFVRPEDKQDLQKTLDLLDKYFQGNVNVTFERFQFLKRDQRENESFDEYLRSLRVLANTCEFGSLKPN